MMLNLSQRKQHLLTQVRVQMVLPNWQPEKPQYFLGLHNLHPYVYANCYTEL